MRECAVFFVVAGMLGGMSQAVGDGAAPFRPPAVPLVAHDPYFSVWCPADRLTDTWSRHWTGKVQALCGLIRVDGKAMRFAGVQPDGIPAMRQTGLTVTPTRSIFQFEDGGVALTVEFCSPLLPDDLEILSRPVTYLTFGVRAVDGGTHMVELYTDITGEWAVDKPGQKVVWGRADQLGILGLKLGTKEQPVLEKKGDDLRIDWGHVYLAAPIAEGVRVVAAGAELSRDGFVRVGALPELDDLRMPRRADDDWPVLAWSAPLGGVAADAVSRRVMLAYDDEWSIELMGEKLRPWWRCNGMDAAGMLAAANTDADMLLERCRAFDAELTADLEKAGGAPYARLCALAYRQAMAAHKLAAGKDGKPLLFSKENFSNGCIATVDVTYPSAPVFLLLNTALLRALTAPVMDYAASDRWPWPFAPHDLGTYPKANGQAYGGGEKTEENQMPVEESANLVLLAAALARAEGGTAFAEAYWPQLAGWAAYLREKGLDPENQLCTDDFAGHLAHNANLSLKAILALGGYAQLCGARDMAAERDEYRALAEGMAKEWMEMAGGGAGGAYRLAFDKPGTWSQKYNLVWDRLLGLDLFPPEVAQKETAQYLKALNRYGLPLDNRKDYTKIDWIVWSATLSGNRADFDAIIAPAYAFAQETPDRVPLTDWYDTVTGKVVGFQARSVVGGLFLPMLYDGVVAEKWRARAAK